MKTSHGISVHPLPPTPSHVGEGEFSNSRFRKAPFPLVGENWDGGCERLRHSQQGGVLIISLVILLVMTLLGVSAMTGSGLQERMVGNQKQAIGASMAAEAGAITAVRWLRAHPGAWGNAEAWKAGDVLPSRVPSAPNFGKGGVVYWVESIRFDGDTAVIVSRGGVLIDGKILGQSAVTVALQNESAGTGSAPGANQPAGNGEGERHEKVRGTSATIGSTTGFVGLNTQSASVGVQTEPDPAPASDAASHASDTTRPDELSGAKSMRGKVLYWRQMPPVANDMPAR